MTEKKCYIIGAGAFYNHIIKPEDGDLVIAADAGYKYLTESNIKIDIVIGDFDSLPCPPRHPKIIRLNKEKDDTDMLAAIRIGLEQKYKIFHIYGGTGGRLDHTLANIQSAAWLSQNGAQCYLYGEDYVICAITDCKMEFDERFSGTISVFAHNEKAEGVYLKGLKYPLDNATLKNTFPIGVSNEFTGAKSSVEVKKGTLILIYNEVRNAGI